MTAAAEIDVAAHVAFELDRAWCDDVVAALAEVATGAEGRLAVVLARWWARREARLDTLTVALEPAVRAELVAGFPDDELFADLARTAPAVVRLDALVRLRRAAPRLARLVAVDAPMIVLDRERETCARLLDEIDPKARREAAPVPELSTVPDAAGNEVVDLTRWIDRMLVAAQVDAPDLGLGEAFADRPEARAFVAGGAELTGVRIWPGLSTFAVRPDLAFWASPAIALPRRVEVPLSPPALVAAEASGPITFALAGDTPGPELLPALAARVLALAPSRALVSFIWLAHANAGPWRPIG